MAAAGPASASAALAAADLAGPAAEYRWRRSPGRSLVGPGLDQTGLGKTLLLFRLSRSVDEVIR